LTLSLETYKKFIYSTTAKENLSKIEKYSLADVLAEVFRIEIEETERPLLNEYEKLAILNWSDPIAYANSKYRHLQKVIEKIELNGWQASFLRLFSGLFQDYTSRDLDGIYEFLFTELSDTWDLLYIKQGKYVVGIDYDQKTFLLQDRTSWSDLLYFYEQQYKYGVNRQTKASYIKNIGSYEKEQFYIRICDEDIFRSKMLCLLARYITPKSIGILPKVWLSHKQISLYETREFKPTEYYISLLQNRRYLLDRKGVKVSFQNGTVFEHLIFLEVLNHKNRTVLLFKYKLPMDDGESVGVYDIDANKFFTVYSDSSDREVRWYNEKFKNFILEVYTELTCDFDKGDSNNCLILDTDADFSLINDADNFLLYSCDIYTPPVVEEGSKLGTKKGSHQRPHDRMHATRDLPKGWKTSERAKKLAAEFNVKLNEGETFVSPYKVGLTSVRTEVKRSVGRPQKE
jgi:hypothetical protein